jgi:hypothetical protein
MIKAPRRSVLLAFGVLTLSACTTAKFEARLEANPQCKEVINAKTGALMPCPGTDRAFYRAAGLEPTKPTSGTPIQVESSSSGVTTTVTNTSSNERNSASIKTDCKPTIHNKTGGLMPCLPPDQ